MPGRASRRSDLLPDHPVPPTAGRWGLGKALPLSAPPDRAASADADASAEGAATDAGIGSCETGALTAGGFTLTVRAGGRQYRVAPARDPRQPRFWCLVVYRCAPGGLATAGERPWIGARGMTRDELPAALAAIRGDVDGWLAREECRELREWLLAPDPAYAGGTGRAGAEGG